MTTRVSQVMAATLGTFAILASAASQVSAAETKQNDPIATPTAYVNYLRHSQEEGASDALKAFQDLTDPQQNQFIDYLHNPAILKSVLDKSADQGNGVSVSTGNSKRTSSLYNGDIVIGQERTVSGLSATSTLSSGHHTVKYTTYVKVLGVKVIKLNLAVSYNTNSKDITKVTNAEATKRNLSGVVSLSHQREKRWLSSWSFCERGKPCSGGHHANASVVWEGSVVYKGSAIEIDKKQYMRANFNGKLIDYYLHNV